ncbi:DUF6255 family natural product biosynthesis protein [Streptomyces sp. KLMMK]|uniref:DUF6255 family natural product biosynthesis protein n=1 Tax=Streptomyces sp. KLMMK TaxID=3109353 RepID=UPI003FA683B5
MRRICTHRGGWAARTRGEARCRDCGTVRFTEYAALRPPGLPACLGERAHLSGAGISESAATGLRPPPAPAPRAVRTSHPPHRSAPARGTPRRGR